MAMGYAYRYAAYTRQTGANTQQRAHALTPAQRRRARHKMNRALRGTSGAVRCAL